MSQIADLKRLHGLPDLREAALRPVWRRCFWTWPWGHAWDSPVCYSGRWMRRCAACGCWRQGL